MYPVLFVSALWGLVWGSFASAVVHRIPKGESIWKPSRSYCPECGTTLSPRDLVPVFSWLFLKGRCRYCKSPIPVRELLIEIGSAVFWAYLAWKLPLSSAILFGFLFEAMWICAWIDLDEGIIPDAVMLPVFFAVLIWMLGTSGWAAVAQSLLLGAGIPFLLAVPNWMGWGDVKLFALLSLIFGGLAGLRLMVYASALALIFYPFLHRREIPFGPFIFLATFLLL